MKNRSTNWRAMQVPPRREKGLPTAWLAQGDVNIKQMGMGSWKARANQGGAKCK